MTHKAAAKAHHETPEKAAVAEEPTKLQEQSQAIIRRHVYWAMGLGLVPIPLFDLVAVTGVQVKMIKDISKLYKIDYKEDAAKTAVASLLAGIGSLSLSSSIAGSLFKIIPGVGQLFGAVGVSVIGGALTTAVGSVFTMHYESGGTLLTFDASKVRDYFRQEYEKAKESVKHLTKDDKHSETAAP